MAEPHADATAAGYARSRLLAAQTAGFLAAFLVSLDYTAITVALPSLSREFGVGTSRVAWASLSYMLVMVMLTPLAGALIGRMGSRRALIGGYAIFAAASLGASLAGNLVLLVAMRALQGVGAAVMFTMGPTIIKQMVPEERQSRSFAVFAIGPMVGLAAGPAIGGQLTALYGWPAVFLANLPIAAAGAALSIAVAGSEHRRNAPPALPGAGSVGLASLTLAAAVLVLNQGQEWGWTSAPTLGLAAAALIAGLAFARLEAVSANPLIDRQVVSDANFIASGGVFAVVLLVFGGTVFLMPFYFEWLRGLSPGVTGRILMSQPLAAMAASALVAVALGAVRRKLVCAAGIISIAAGLSVIAAAPADGGVVMPVLGLVLFGLGAGLYFPALMELSLRGVPPPLAARAASLQTTIRVAAQMLGVVLFESVLSAVEPAALQPGGGVSAGAADESGLHAAFVTVLGTGAAVALLALLPVSRLREPRRSIAK